MTLQIFLMLLLIVSVLVSLTVEALKKVLNDKVPSNIMVGIASTMISIAIGIAYYILAKITFSMDLIVYFVALIKTEATAAVANREAVNLSVNKVLPASVVVAM